MALSIKYSVHSANPVPVEVEVEHNGVKLPASVPGLVVELVAEDGEMTHTLRWIPKDMAAALDLFEPGSTIIGKFDKEKA